MALIKGNCSNCGGKIEFDDGLKKGVCMSCGTPFIAEQIVQNNIQNIKIENAVIENGANLENLLYRAKQYDATDEFLNARQYAITALDIDAHNKEALLIYDRNRELVFRLGTFTFNCLLKKYVDEIERCINNNFEQAICLYERYAMKKWRKGLTIKILKKWRAMGLKAVLDFDFCTKALYDVKV